MLGKVYLCGGGLEEPSFADNRWFWYHLDGIYGLYWFSSSQPPGIPVPASLPSASPPLLPLKKETENIHQFCHKINVYTYYKLKNFNCLTQIFLSTVYLFIWFLFFSFFLCNRKANEKKKWKIILKNFSCYLLLL